MDPVPPSHHNNFPLLSRIFSVLNPQCHSSETSHNKLWKIQPSPNNPAPMLLKVEVLTNMGPLKVRQRMPLRVLLLVTRNSNSVVKGDRVNKAHRYALILQGLY